MVKSKGEKVFDAVNVVFMILLSAVFIFPTLLIVCASFTSSAALTKFGYSLIIREFSLSSYKYIFTAQDMFIRSLMNSLFVTVVGTFCVVVSSALFAYSISRRQLAGKKFFVMFLVITLLFSGGTIPCYLNINDLNLINSIWALILPAAANAWDIILMRNFFAAMPESYSESAQLEGANNVQVLFRIVIPLSFPIVATIILFSAVAYWNDWFAAMLYLDSNHSNLWPVQTIIKKMEEDFTVIVSGVGGGSTLGLNSVGIKAAAVVVSTLPIVIVYPLLQRYFIAGSLVGGVKE